MNNKFRIIIVLLAGIQTVTAQGTAFTYQGHLTANSNPANGRYDFIFDVFDSSSGGSTLAGSVNTNNVPVTNGLFTVGVDFGSAPFTGAPRWLQIRVSTNGAGAYFTLLPRQPLTPSPYAVFSGTAGTVTNGAIATAQLANNAVNTSQL